VNNEKEEQNCKKTLGGGVRGVKETGKNLRITGFVGFVHRPEFYITRKREISETGPLLIFRQGEDRHLLFWVP
jgi:uncharacterized protein YfaT (DUF1175 family)